MKLYILLLASLFSLPIIASEELKSQIFTMSVTENGFIPSNLKVKTTMPITLKITRKTDATCAREIVLPAKKINVSLPLNKEVEVNIGKVSKGEIKFGCAMDMMVSGIIIAE